MESAWALDLAGGYSWVNYLLTLSRIRYHVPSCVHASWLVGWMVGFTP